MPLVFVKDRNVYFINEKAKIIQLTNQGQDDIALLSPDKHHVVFLRKSAKQLPKQCQGLIEDKNGHQIWVVNTQEQKPRLLVNQNFTCDKASIMVLDPLDLTFSPDSKTLYFLTYAWTTSAALHSVNLNDGQERYLVPANSLHVVKKGEYKGSLILNQHRYFIGGGSYDWYWLFSPEGKEVGPLGEEPSIK